MRKAKENRSLGGLQINSDARQFDTVIFYAIFLSLKKFKA